MIKDRTDEELVAYDIEQFKKMAEAAEDFEAFLLEFLEANTKRCV